MPLLMLSKTGLLCIMSGCKRDDSTMISKYLNIAVLIFIAFAWNIFIRFHQLHGLWSLFVTTWQNALSSLYSSFRVGRILSFPYAIQARSNFTSHHHLYSGFCSPYIWAIYSYTFQFRPDSKHSVIRFQNTSLKWSFHTKFSGLSSFNAVVLAKNISAWISINCLT